MIFRGGTKALRLVVLATAIFSISLALGLNGHMSGARIFKIVGPLAARADALPGDIVDISDLDDGGVRHLLPESLDAIHISGKPDSQMTVSVTVVVSPEGDVISAQAESDAGTYADAAEAVARRWKFLPFERGGQKVFARLTAPVFVYPPERRPAARTPFPKIRDWKTLRITLQRGGCYGNCPVYDVTIRGDGTVEYDGKYFVTIAGRHRAQLPHAVVEKIVDRFRQAEFFWLFDRYHWGGMDLPAWKATISFDDRRKSVVDCKGTDVGIPIAAHVLADEIDQLAGVARWTRGNAETVPGLAAEGWDFHAPTCENQHIVSGMVRLGTAGGLRDLLARGTPVGKKCEFDDAFYYMTYASELEIAAARGTADMVSLLLATGAFRDASVLHNALVAAAGSGNLDVVRMLHQAIAASAGGRKIPGDDALRAGAASCNPDVVRFLLDATTIVDINADGGSEWGPALFATAGTADREAALRSRLRCDLVVRQQVKAGATVNLRDSLGATPLHYAQSNPSVARVLIAAGADVNAADKQGGTPLMSSWTPEVTRLLLEAGADPYLKDDIGQTALDRAEKDNRPAIQACARVLRDWMAAHPPTGPRQ